MLDVKDVRFDLEYGLSDEYEYDSRGDTEEKLNNALDVIAKLLVLLETKGVLSSDEIERINFNL